MIRSITDKDKHKFNTLALHPLQSWEWGEFREKTGVEVVRLGKFEEEKLVETAQITIHPIPFTSWSIGYFPKGNAPSAEMIQALIDEGKKRHCIFIKLEPNVRKNELRITNNLQTLYPKPYTLNPSSHPLFTKYTFQLNLMKSEEDLLKGMHPKTRYNIKVAQKHSIVVKSDDSPEAFEEYLRLTFETTKRQHFYAHTEKYHRLMWETLRESGIAHLFTATLSQDGKKHTLVTWIVFLFNNILYYPYGASSSEHRNTMASNLMMWEVIKWGKNKGAKLFDMWGALGPNPDPKDPWHGFHRFKQGYGAEHVEFIGSYDLVIDPILYRLYNAVHAARQIFLKLKSYL